MPLDKTIGSQGLEQGGANLGNDYSRPTPHVEQNETTNIGSHGVVKEESDKKLNEENDFSQDDVDIVKERSTDR